jgi:O-methyltransferase/methyltransferase family protein
MSLMELINGYEGSAVVSAAAQLGIADTLYLNGPTTLADLAAAIHADPATLSRLMAALVALGVVTGTAREGYELTAYGSPLAGDHPESVRATVLLGSAGWHWHMWGTLAETVLSGQPMWVKHRTSDFYALLAHDSPARAQWHDMLVSHARRNAAEFEGLAKAYDFGAAGLLLDVGGGRSSALRGLIEVVPGLRGVIFDRPEVAYEIEAELIAEGLQDRCGVLGGDFFRDRLPAADTYLLTWLLMEWRDDRAVALLANCARAASESNASVVVVETAVEGSAAWGFDLELLVTSGGRLRTDAELGALFARAGLVVLRRFVTDGGNWLFELAPVTGPAQVVR